MSDHAQYSEWLKTFNVQLTPPISATPSSAIDSPFLDQSLVYLNHFSTTQPILTTNDDSTSSFSNSSGIPLSNLPQQSHGISQIPYSSTLPQWQPIAPDTDAYMATLDPTVISQLTGTFTSSFATQPTDLSGLDTSFSLDDDAGSTLLKAAHPPGYIESASSFTNLPPIAKPIPIRPSALAGSLISSDSDQAYMTPYQFKVPASFEPPPLRLRHSTYSSIPSTQGSNNVLSTQSLTPVSVHATIPSSGVSVEVQVEIRALEKDISEWQENKTKKERDWDIHQFKKSVAERGTKWNPELEKNRYAQYERRHRYVIEDCNWYIDDRKNLLERLKNPATSAEAMACVEERRMSPLRGMKPTRNEIKRNKKEQLLLIKKPQHEARKRRRMASSPGSLKYHGETQLRRAGHTQPIAHESIQSLHGMEQAVTPAVEPPLPAINAPTQIGRPLYVKCTGEDGSTEKPFTVSPSETSASGIGSDHSSSLTPRISQKSSHTGSSGVSLIASNSRVYSEIVIARWKGKVEHRRTTLRKVLKTWRKKVARASQEQVLVPVTIRDNEPPSVVSMMENAVERFRDNSMLETVQVKQQSLKRRHESIGKDDQISVSFPSADVNEESHAPLTSTFDAECRAPEDTVTRDEDDDVVPLKDVETIIVGKEMELKREKIKEAVQQEKDEKNQDRLGYASWMKAQADLLVKLLAAFAPSAPQSEFASMASFDPPSQKEKEWWNTTEGSVYCPRCGEEVGGGPTRRKNHYKKRHHSIFYKLAPPSHKTKLEKELHVTIGADAEGLRTCLFCAAQVSNRMLMLRHFEQKHPQSLVRVRYSFASLANRKEKADEGEVYRYLNQ